MGNLSDSGFWTQTGVFGSGWSFRTSTTPTGPSIFKPLGSSNRGLLYNSTTYRYSSKKNYIFKTTLRNWLLSQRTSGASTGFDHLTFFAPWQPSPASWNFRTNGNFNFSAFTQSMRTYYPGGPGDRDIRDSLLSGLDIFTLIELITNPSNFWSAQSFGRYNTSPPSDLTGNQEVTLISMSSPSTTFGTSNRGSWRSDCFLGGLMSYDIIETDWFFQGYSWATASGGASDVYSGWRFDKIGDDFELTYKWLYASSATSSMAKMPAPYFRQSASQPSLTSIITPNSSGFSNQNFFPVVDVSRVHSYRIENYACKYIDIATFNLEFEFETTGGTYGVVDAYLLRQRPSSTLAPTNNFQSSLSNGQYLGRITATSSTIGDVSKKQVSFFNLTGNNWLVFVSYYPSDSLTTVLSGGFYNKIRNVIIRGGYLFSDNNVKKLLTNSSNFNSTQNLQALNLDFRSRFDIKTTTRNTFHEIDNLVFGPTGGRGSFGSFFSSVYGTVSNVGSLKSKVGNGTFRAGIWENGVWNNGWRDDDQVFEFTDVKFSIRAKNDELTWYIQLTGPTSSISQFRLGENVAISNIVAFDLNEQRNLLKNYFKIIRKNSQNLVVEVKTDFPYRRIEKDSENHKILITRNVWLNGAFLNGYYQGVWNDGLFRGFPYITEMYDSHWIDGTFDGGHFSATKLEKRFSDTYYYLGNVGLTFGATAHGLKVGDIIEIDKDDKTINSEYDGQTTIIEVVDDYLAITDLDWLTNTNSESGRILSQSTGLIQNFIFNDNNVASFNSRRFHNPIDIWKYNSWIDVNFSDQSTTNIGRNRLFYNQEAKTFDQLFGKFKLGIGDYTPLNLYGFVTDDILSSDSTFRDIDSNTRRTYSLGTKYEIYQDFLDDISQFNKPFGTSPQAGGLKNFIEDGWTYSTSGSRIKYPRETTINGVTYYDRYKFRDNFYVIFEDDAKIGFIGNLSEVQVDFEVGEEIFVKQFSPFTNPSYDGPTTILDVLFLEPSQSNAKGYGLTDSIVIVTDKDFRKNTPLEGGIIYYKKGSGDAFTFSRTVDGTFLLDYNDRTFMNFTLNNTNIDIERNRYSVIEFDYLNGPENIFVTNINDIEDVFSIHYIDLFNFTNFSSLSSGDLIYGPTHAFPNPPTSDYPSIANSVWSSGLDYKKTKSTRKVEYFYNRTSLDLGFMSLAYFSGQFGFTQSFNFEVDNIKFYEVDMIPFFQYTTPDFVNRSVQIPYQGIAPVIDYRDDDFSFVNSIQFGIDSVILNQSNRTVTLPRIIPELIFTPDNYR
jgi:hypothetical protein